MNPDCINEGENYFHGPLTLVVDRLVKERHHYSILDANVVGFVPRGMLKAVCKNDNLRKIVLPSAKEKKETRFYFLNAMALAYIANNYAKKQKDDVVAILFADTDKSNDRGDYDSKYQSIIDGFKQGSLSRGVPMIAKPVSEAWFLCAISKKRNPNQDCASLENEAYGSGSQHQLKDRLEAELKVKPDREVLCEKMENQELDFTLVNLPSYLAFKTRLETVI
jgi:hypothetical protein